MDIQIKIISDDDTSIILVGLESITEYKQPFLCN